MDAVQQDQAALKKPKAAQAGAAPMPHPLPGQANTARKLNIPAARSRAVALPAIKHTLHGAAAVIAKEDSHAGAAAAGEKPAVLVAAQLVPKPKVKPKAADVDVSALNVPALFASGRLASLTIPQLKAYLKSVKLPVGGKKGELEERVHGHLVAFPAAQPTEA